MYVAKMKSVAIMQIRDIFDKLNKQKILCCDYAINL